MRKRRFLVVAVLLSLLLIACSASPQEGAMVGQGGAANPVAEGDSGARRPSQPPAADGRASAGQRNVAPAPTTAAAAAPNVAAAAATAAPAAKAAAGAPSSLASGSDQAAKQSAGEINVPQQAGRMIIYTTDVALLVKYVDAFPAEVGQIAQRNGGYVAGVEVRDEGGVPTSVVRLRVAPERYNDAMHGLRGLAVEARGEQAATQDVTEEYSDIRAQLASLEATHAQLLELQKRATTVEEVLKIQAQAAQVKLQIDRLKGRGTALERHSELATITARAQSAEVVLQRDYTAARAALRRAEATRATLEAQLRRARALEERAAIGDKLGKVMLEISRHQARVTDIEAKAQAHQIALPKADPVVSQAPQAVDDESLPQKFIDAHVALRRADWEQSELMKAIRDGRPGVDASRLGALILEISRLTTEVKQIQERAAQIGVALPTLTPEQEAALAKIPSPSAPGFVDAIRGAWDASLAFLGRNLTRLARVLVFLWWLIPMGVVGLLLLRRQLALALGLARAGAAPAAPPASGAAS